MAAPDLKDPVTFGAMALLAAVVLTARRQAKRHHDTENDRRITLGRRRAGLGFFGPFKKKRPAAVKTTEVEREANDLAREGQKASQRGRCAEGRRMIAAAKEVADTVVITYAEAIHNESCPAEALAGARGRRRRRR